MKINYVVITILTCVLTCQCLNSQNNKSEMAAYNIGLGSLSGGIGALINKKPGERWENVLLKGMGQGALGGYLIYESKNLIGDIEQKQGWEYGWYSKIVNSAGVSIVENAASNRDFWEQWNVNIGFNRFEFHAKDEFRFKYKVMPVSLGLTIYTAIGNKFELERTLQTGELIFSSNEIGFDGIDARGAALGNVLLINSRFLNTYDLYAHEFIHVYQYYDYNFVNSYIDKPIENWRFRSETFTKLDNIFHWDLQALVLRPLYLLENNNRNCYYENFFENEAGFYSNTINCN